MAVNFKVGDIVWARIKNNPAWPARIENSVAIKKDQVYVFYFGAKPKEQFGWVSNSMVTLFNPNDPKHKQLIQAASKSDLKAAIKLAQEEYEQNGTVEGENGADSEQSSLDTSLVESVNSASQDVGMSGRSSKKRSSTTELAENGTTQAKRTRSGYGTGKYQSYLVNAEANLPQTVEEDICVRAAEPEVENSVSTIGFLCLGHMGSAIVRKLIKAGFKMALWSRTSMKCEDIKKEVDLSNRGQVEICTAPCDVIKAADIVFSCSANPEVAENNVVENCGIAFGDILLAGKGFVEMGGIDPQTSVKIRDAINKKGGRYLEAQLQGTRDDATNGNLHILAAGNEKLYEQCQIYFEAIAAKGHFLGEVGMGSKVYLILQMMNGIFLSGLAEGLVMADRCGIAGKDIVNIFEMTNMMSPYLINKAKKIISKDFHNVEMSIDNIQKDLRLALGLSDDLMQPLMMTSAANEVFKHSRKLGYGDQDCSCIYMKARY